MSENKKGLFEKLLTRGVENVYPSYDFVADKLNKEKISIYLGIDPTGPTLHLGHVIPLMKLKQFQKLGHKIILLIGDFTAQIGDPTDKSATRKPLTKEQVLENCKKYKEQASILLDFEGDNPAELKFNSEWLEKMNFKDVVELSSNFTVQQLLERDMFAKRMEEGKPISMHEFMYPLMQGYDSVAMNIDGEIGGNDQTFNMLAGRTLMKKICNEKEKFVITMKILEDTTGVKMGKTTGNMISLDDTSEQMFGAVMSWTDGMIIPGFELCTELEMDQVKEYEKRMEAGENPRDFKMLLGKEIVKFYFDENEAEKVEQNFINQFKNKEVPEDIPEYELKDGDTLIDVMVSQGLVTSNGEARRMVDQNAVKLEGETMTDVFMNLTSDHKGQVLKVGKRRFLRVM